MKILLADDHAVVRRGLRKILEDELPGAEFGEAENAAQVQERLQAGAWDLLLLDVNMPDRSGLDLLKELKATQPKLPVLVISIHPEDQLGIRTLRAGAGGYLSKSAPPSEMVAAVKKLLAGGRYVSESLGERLAATLPDDAQKQPHELLSDREFQVMRMLASGRSVSEIAENLCLSVKTVSTYRTRVLEKMSLRTNADLTRYAMQNRLVE